MKKQRLLSLILAIVTVVSTLVFTSSAVVTKNDYTAEELDSSSYDLYKYVTPFWQGNIVYNECVMPIRNKDGSLPYFELMYKANEIVSVKNYTLDVTYTEGPDYRLTSDGKLEIMPTGKIPIYAYTTLHPTAASGAVEDSNHYPHADDEDFEFWAEDSRISQMNIVVTYIHNDTWSAPIPEKQYDNLPNTMSKLMHKEPLSIVVAGDSVSTGANSSRFLGISPFADAYPEMTAAALREKFGNDNITLVNSAIGGTMSNYDNAKLDDTIIKYSPDLVMICFGMNDSSCDRVGISGAEFKQNMSGQIEYIKSKLPNAEILLIASVYGNIFTFPAERYEEHAAILHELADEYSGVGVADPQMIEKSLLEKKDYVTFMADNMVHPNDYGMRLIAQTILEALDVEDMSSYKRLLIADLVSYADLSSRADWKKSELRDALNKYSHQVMELDDAWKINDVMDEAYDEIEFIIGKCDPDKHVYEMYTVAPTCKTDGYTHSNCTVCGYEYDHSIKPALGGEHAMDSGRVTTSPTYKKAGIKTYTCALCGYEEYEEVPMLTNAPTMSGAGMIYVPMGFNYKAGPNMYQNGIGTFEADVCPLNIVDAEGTPYFGLWISQYNVAVSYNFREQRVEIVTNTNLPYGGNPIVIASAKYDWTPDNGEYKYNWKKYAVNVNANTHTVKVYINGELILTSTDSRYHVNSTIGLFYSIGEYYIDNVRIGGTDYDPVTGSGTVRNEWKLNDSANANSFFRSWGNGSYVTSEFVNATRENVTTGNHVHSHLGRYLGTVDPTCSGQGYKEYECETCGAVVRLDYRNPTNEAGHVLCNRVVIKNATDTEPGKCKYECENCYTTFTQIIPIGTGTDSNIIGDANNDGKVDIVDAVLIERKMAGWDVNIYGNNGDANGDGTIDGKDAILIRRKVSGWGVDFAN